MRGQTRRVVVAFLAILAAIPFGGPALAATSEVVTEPVDQSFVGAGCSDAALETIHVSGWRRTIVVEGDDFLLVHGTISFTQSWTETETGESFSGPVSGPWSFRILPSSDAGTYSDVFTAIARGDQGTTAIFKGRLHTIVNANGDVTADIAWFSTTCR